MLDTNKHLRPISLTCCLDRTETIAEESVFEKLVGPATLQKMLV